MKKILTIVMTIILSFVAILAVNAYNNPLATYTWFINTIGYTNIPCEIHQTVEADITVKKAAASAFDQGPINVTKTDKQAFPTFDFKATLFMDSVRNLFSDYESKARSVVGTDPDDVAVLESTPVTGKFTVTITYPSSLKLPDDAYIYFTDTIDKTFTEVDREITTVSSSTKALVLTVDVKDGITFKKLSDDLETYLPDLELVCYGAQPTKYGNYMIQGEVTGYTVIGDVTDPITMVTYNASQRANVNNYSYKDVLGEKIAISKISDGIKSGSTSTIPTIVNNSFNMSLYDNKIEWGGGIKYKDAPSDEDAHLYVGFYDGAKLLSVKETTLDNNINAFSFAEQTIRLKYAPESVTGKAFIWDNDGKMTPLCEAVTFSAENQGPDFMFFAENNLNQYLRIDEAKTDIKLRQVNDNYYVSGELYVNASGNDMYNCVIRVKNGDKTVYENIIPVDSRLEYVEISDKLDFVPTKYMYTTIDFIHGNDMLYETLETDWDTELQFDTDEPKEPKEGDTGYFEAYGRIVATHTQGCLDIGEVEFQIEKTNNYCGDVIDSRKYCGTEQLEIINCPKEYEKYLFMYSKASIKYVYKNGSYHCSIVALTPIENDIVELNASDYSWLDSVSIAFNISPTSTKTKSYKLADSVGFYVNGVEIGGSLAIAVANYIDGNDIGKVTLIDTPQVGTSSKDGKYDYIFVTMQKWAIVDSTMVSGSVNKIFFDDSEGLGESVSLDTDDEDFEYEITKNGEKIDFADIKENDVLLIKYDVTYRLKNSYFVYIDVCDTKVTGKVTEARCDDGWSYIVNGQEYKYIDDYVNVLTTGNIYDLYLDSTGRIVKFEESASNYNYAVLDRVYYDNNLGETKARIIKADGTRESYVIKNNDEIYTIQKIAYGTEVNDGTLVPVDGRVITYKLNSRDEIHTVATVSVCSTLYEYKIATKRVGAAKMTDTTTVIDLSGIADPDKAEDYTASDIRAGSINSFIDGEVYRVLYGGTKRSDGSYPVVIILEGNTSISVKTHFAVLDSVSTAEYEADGSERTTITVYIAESKSEKVTYFLDEDVYDTPIKKLTRGDVVVYGLSVEGLVDKIQVLWNTDPASPLNISEIANLPGFDKTLDPKGKVPYCLSGVDKWDCSKIGDTNGYARVGAGIILDKLGYDITFGLIDKCFETTSDNIFELSLNSDCKVYVLDYNEQNKATAKRLTIGDSSNIYASQIPDTSKSTDYMGYDVYNWSNYINALDGYNYLNYAFYKTLDGEITDILVVIPANDTEASTSESFGIVDRVYEEGSTGTYKARIITEDGRRENFTINTSDVSKLYSIAYGSTTNLNNLQEISKRVVSYKLNSRNEISSISSVPMSEATDLFDYDTSTIGTAKLSDSTILLDMSKTVAKEGNLWNNLNYTDYDIRLASLESFNNDESYTVLYSEADKFGDAKFAIMLAGNNLSYAQNESYGVIDRVYYDNNSGETKARIIKPDGTRLSYIIKNNDEIAGIQTIAYGTDVNDGTLVPVDGRVISYKLNSKNEIYSVQNIYVNYAKDEFNSATSKLGSAKIGENTAIVDLSGIDGLEKTSSYSASDIKAGSYNTFKNGEEYCILYGDKNSYGSYDVVVILEGNALISVKTNFAVIDSVSTAEYEADGSERTTITVYTAASEDEKVTLYLDEDVNDAPIKALTRGDVVVYGTSAEGLVDKINVLWDTDPASALTISEIAALHGFDKTLDPKGKVPYLLSGVDKWDCSKIGDTNGYARVGAGIILDRQNNNITFGLVDDDYETKGNNIFEVSLDSDVNVYVLDYNEQNKSTSGRLTVGGASSITKTSVPTIAINEDYYGNDVYEWDKYISAMDGYRFVNYAFFKTLDGEITDILVVIPADYEY